LLIDGEAVNSGFHDSGAVVTCIGRRLLESIAPGWESKFPRASSIPLVSHTNHSLKVLGARLVPLAIPGTDINLVHPIHIEEDGQDLVIGRDLITKCQIGLEWRGDGKLCVTLPSANRSGKKWELPVFQPPGAVDVVRNNDEVTLEGGEEKLVQVVGKGRARVGEKYVIRRLNTGRSDEIFVIDTITQPIPIDGDKWRGQILVKNLALHPQTLPVGHLRCSVDEVRTDDKIVSLAEISNHSVRGKWFEQFATENELGCH